MNGKQTSVNSDNGGQCVARFTDDGQLFLIFDASLSADGNKKLAAVVVAEGKRRLKAGRSDAVGVRERQNGHQNMLEYSGELKRNVTRSITISGTSKEVRGRLPGSQKANFKRTPESPDVRAEILSISQPQATQLAMIVEAKVSTFLNSNEGTLTVSP